MGIIGIVAALTIPSLMTKINDKVTSTKKEVMERKLVQGLNMLSNKESGLNVTYNNTEDFVQALSKYLKMSAICGKDDLNKCFPYDKITYLDDEETKTINVSSITKDKMKLQGNWLEPAGFIMSDGTPFIISYNNDCSTVTDSNGKSIVDPDLSLKEIPLGCLDGVYDNNGASSPNKYGRDVQPLFAARFGKTCLLKTDNSCIISTPAVFPTPVTFAWCEANKSRYGIDACCTLDTCKKQGDYWAGAKKMCQDQGMRLPTEAELVKLAEYLYDSAIASSGTTENLALNTAKIPDALSDIGLSWRFLWSDYGYSPNNSFARQYDNTATARNGYFRYNSYFKAFCVSN